MIITCTHHRLQSASIVSKCLATAVESGEWMMNWKKKRPFTHHTDGQLTAVEEESFDTIRSASQNENEKNFLE